MLREILVKEVVRSPQIKSLREGVDQRVGRRLGVSRVPFHKEEGNHDQIDKKQKSHDLREVKLRTEGVGLVAFSEKLLNREKCPHEYPY